MYKPKLPARAPLLAGAVTIISLFGSTAHAQTLKQLQQQVAALTATVTSQGQQITSLQTTVASQATQINSLQSSLSALNALKSFFTISGSDVSFTGNLHIVNGSGNSYHANGLGNLFLGYSSTNTVTGSHNLITGNGNTVGGCDSLVSGSQNKSLGYDQLVLGGQSNTVYGDYGFSIGAQQSTEIPIYGGLVGGQQNTISDLGRFGVVVGGILNVLECPDGGILSGSNNTLGGYGTNAIVGGDSNLIDGDNTFGSVICGGTQNHGDNQDNFMGGGYGNHNSGQTAVMLGGYNNVILSTGLGAGTVSGFNVSLNSDYYGSIGATIFNP